MLWLFTSASAATLSVGPSGTYASPCAAIAAASTGDVIEVDASGDYAGDTCSWSTDGLTVKGVNGQPTLDGTGASMAEQKGIFVIHAENATIENLAFRGAAVADLNGAGIRHQGINLTVRGCRFEDNENGILGSPSTDGTGRVEVTGSEFVHNGAGDGYSHNLYLGHYAEVSFRSSYSHAGNAGHLFKSRAAYTEIVASRLTDESGGGASYEVDLPNGGEGWIVGSVIEQVGSTQNSGIIAFGEEGAGSNTVLALHVVNSTIVNHHDRGTFLSIGGAVTTPVEVVNTVFAGPGTLSSQASTAFTSSWDDSLGDPGFVDDVGLDVHPAAGSPLIDAGAPPPDAVPVDAEYAPTAREIPRGIAGSAIDIGAFEYGNPGIDEDTGAPDGEGSPASDTGDADDTGAGASDCGCQSGAGSGVGLAAAAFGLAARRRRAG